MEFFDQSHMHGSTISETRNKFEVAVTSLPLTHYFIWILMDVCVCVCVCMCVCEQDACYEYIYTMQDTG